MRKCTRKDLLISLDSFWLFKTKIWLEPSDAEGYLLAYGQGRIEQPTHRKDKDADGLYVLLMSWALPSLSALLSSLLSYEWQPTAPGLRVSVLVLLPDIREGLASISSFSVKNPRELITNWSGLGWMSNPGPVSQLQWVEMGRGKAKEEHGCRLSGHGMLFYGEGAGGMWRVTPNLWTSSWTCKACSASSLTSLFTSGIFPISLSLSSL